MSTEHQKYSTENQADIIQAYAGRRGFEIVKTYADQGKSGLRIEGRDALKQLLADVQAGRADYKVILVYDVSRWGRFQDADESAYYEYLCREAGISVHYCAEQFENDGSLTATIIKGMKRAMAGEYSRELSAKVFTGQCRLISLGYRQGGPAGFGLRRQLVDEQRRPKALLDRGEHKSLQTDRVILTAGPQEEIDVVQRIYRMFVLQRRPEREIAIQLNAGGVTTDLDRPWTRGTVHQVLTNEKYIGNNVYNRVSFKLKKKRVLNTPDTWVRADGVFQGIVDPEFFAAAQRIIADRARRFTDEELLARLTELLGQKGCLSGLLIDEVEDMPSSSTYRHRFGTLLRAYKLVGYSPDRDYRFLETNRVLRALHPEVVARTIAEVERLGGVIRVDPATDLLTVNEEFTVSVTVIRCSRTSTGGLRWKMRLDAGLKPDITIAVRMDDTNTGVRDYYLLPWLDVGPMGRVRIVRALERGVSEEKLARALDVDVKAIHRRRSLLEGVAPEVIDLLKTHAVNPVTFDMLRKMRPMRQVEAAELMLSANNFTSSYAKALLAATRQADLLRPDKPKRVGGMTADQMARMEREMASLTQDFRALEASYGDDVLHLVVASGYLNRLLGNPLVERYLVTRHPELVDEFRAIITASSLDDAGSLGRTGD